MEEMEEINTVSKIRLI